MVRFRPIGDKVLVEPDKETEEKVGMLFVPESAKQQKQEGVVRAVGPGAYQNGVHIPQELKVGERIVFTKYAGSEYSESGVEYMILRPSEILGVIEEEK